VDGVTVPPLPHDLAALLPGRWTVAATNSPLWLSGERRNPLVEYSLLSENPLRLVDDVSWIDPDGAGKRLVGTDTWDDPSFTWRGTGLKRFAASSWAVTGVGGEGSFVVVRFDKSFVSPAGIDILVREGSDHPELRATVAGSTESLGLSPEDFASLSWLALPVSQ